MTAERVTLDDFNSIPARLLAPSVDADIPLIAKTNGHPPASGPRLVSLEDVEMKDIDWLDEGFVPEATLTIIQGHGGVGKGPWTIQLAARVTRGETPDGKPGRVLFAVAEDDYASVLKPRLVAAGAEMRYVKAVENVTLPEHIAWLEERIVELGQTDDGVPVRLLIIDPILTHIGDKVDSYKDHDVKRALRSLLTLSAQHRVTTVGVLHFIKDTSRGASFSGQASGAFRNTPRSVLSMVLHDEDTTIRLLEVSKSNFGATGLGRRYRIELVPVKGLDQLQVVLRHDGDADKTVDAALTGARTKDKTPDKQALRDLILRELQRGGKSLDYLKAIGKDELEANRNTVYTTANELKKEGLVKTRKLGMDEGWQWELTQNFELSEPSTDSGENGLNSELSPELSSHHVDECSNVPTNGGVWNGQDFGADDDVPL